MDRLESNGLVDRLCRMRLNALAGANTGPKQGREGEVSLNDGAKKQRQQVLIDVGTVLMNSKSTFPEKVNLDNKLVFLHVGTNLSDEFQAYMMHLAGMRSVRARAASRIVVYKTDPGLDCVVFFVDRNTTAVNIIGLFTLNADEASIDPESFRTLNSAVMISNMNQADEMLAGLKVGLENSKDAIAKHRKAHKTSVADQRERRIKADFEEDQRKLRAEFLRAQEMLKAQHTQKMKDLDAQSAAQKEKRQAEIAAETARLNAQVEYWKAVKLENTYSNVVRRGTSKSSGAPRKQALTPVPEKPPSPEEDDAREGPVIAELDSDEDD